jgi:hypothetical protein
MSISGTIEQAPSNAYYFTDVRSNDIVFRAFSGASYCFGAGSNVASILRVNSNNITMLPQNGVGVGTSNPQSSFHLYNGTSNPTFMIDGGGIGNRGTLRLATTNAGNFIQSGAQFSNDARADLIFTSMGATTEWMRIRSTTGNVGIGVANPQNRLEVNGSGLFSGALTANTLAISNISCPSNTSNLNIGCDGSTSIVNIACTTNAQIVNIGTGTTGVTTINVGGPSDIVNITGSLNSISTTNTTISDALITLNKGGSTNSAIGVGLEIEENNAITGYIKTDTTRAGYLLRAPTSTADLFMDLSSGGMNINNNTFVINNVGNVGLNRASPTQRLDVNGNINLGNSGADCFISTPGQLTLWGNRTGNTSFVHMLYAVSSNSSSTVGDHIFYTRGVSAERMRITNAGNIGIGTSTPTQPLDINGIVRARNNIVCYSTASGTGEGGQLTLGYPNSNLSDQGNGTWNIDVFNSNLRAFNISATGTISTAFNITETGNMAIGSTTAPATRLDVYGGATVRSGNMIGSTLNQLVLAPNAADNNKHVIKTRHLATDSTSNSIDFYVWQQSQQTTDIGNKHMLSITSSGVGIATMTPAYMLDINGAVNASNIFMNGMPITAGSFWLQRNGGNWSECNTSIGSLSNQIARLNVYGDMYIAGTGGSIAGTTQGTYVNWNPDATTGRTQIINSRGAGTGGFQFDLYNSSGLVSNAMTVTGTGNVGIGTSLPAYRLDVSGDINFTGTFRQNGAPYVGSQWTTNNSNIYITGSNVGIGTTNPLYSLHIVGSAYSTGDFFAYSDARFKTDLLHIDKALDKVKKITGYTFNVSHPEEKESKNSKRRTGLIAQEVVKVLPEVVSTDDTGLLSVCYGNMMGLIVEAIKELDTKLELISQKLS